MSIQLTLDEFMETLNSDPGLIFGPSITTKHNTYSKLWAECASIHGYGADKNFPGYLNTMRSEGSDVIKILNSYSEQLKYLEPTVELQYLAKVPWCLCISLTQDMLLENTIRMHLDSTPTSRSITVVDNRRVMVRGPSIPCYKLLGNCQNSEKGSSLAVLDSEVLLRQESWLYILSSFMEYLRESPLICLGVDDVISQLMLLFSKFASQQKPLPSRIIFLESDNLTSNQTLIEICESFANVEIVSTSIREICAELVDKKPKQRQLSFQVSEPTSLLEPFNQIISTVPTSEVDPSLFNLHRNEIVDSLFKPTSLDWRPYQLKLPLTRTDESILRGEILQAFNVKSSPRPRYVLVTGHAGVGKTTLAKCLAIDLTTHLGIVTIWCKRVESSGWLNQYHQLVSKLNVEDKKKTKRYLFIIDDPENLRLPIDELFGCFDGCQANFLFLIIYRKSDYFRGESFSTYSPNSIPTKELEISEKLNNGEISNLSELIIKLGIRQNPQEANEMVNQIVERQSRDILSSLWYLIPETKLQITFSLKDEYERLGSPEGFIASVAEGAASRGDAARHAYEIVTVFTELGLSIPIEILVSALHINYSEFLDMNEDGQYLWGLIYDEEDNENSTITFKTRNDVVTKVLLDLVNGGFGHNGELRVIKDVINSCDGSSVKYRSFIEDILVRQRYKLEQIFDYEKGLSLFELALEKVNHADRALEHHKGLWIQRVGKDYKAAYRQLEKAIRTELYPGTTRIEHIEHIHTSLAATITKAIKEGEYSIQSGLEIVKDHINKAKRPKVFSSYNAHVIARVYLEVAQQSCSDNDQSAQMNAASEALKIIEETVQIIGPNGEQDSRNQKSLTMLKELQSRVVEIFPNLEILSQRAKEEFERNQSQSGFVLVARRMLIDSRRGRDFNKVRVYLDECSSIIEENAMERDRELIEINVDLLVRWKLQKQTNKIDWQLFKEDVSRLIHSNQYDDDPLRSFYLAVACAHTGDIVKAINIFQGLRNLRLKNYSPWVVRCYYTDENGNPRSFQGTSQISGERCFISIPELGTDVLMGKHSQYQGHSTTVHVYVGFTFNGLIAYDELPKESALRLPW